MPIFQGFEGTKFLKFAHNCQTQDENNKKDVI